MAKDWVNDACSEAKAAFDARSEVEVELGALKENQSNVGKPVFKGIIASAP